jgi:hypothetical protein
MSDGNYKAASTGSPIFDRQTRLRVIYLFGRPQEQALGISGDIDRKILMPFEPPGNSPISLRMFRLSCSNVSCNEVAAFSRPFRCFKYMAF